MHPRKIAKLQYAIEWIARNDAPLETNLGIISKFKSVCLISDLWNKPAEEVAEQILRLRLNNGLSFKVDQILHYDQISHLEEREKLEVMEADKRNESFWIVADSLIDFGKTYKIEIKDTETEAVLETIQTLFDDKSTHEKVTVMFKIEAMADDSRNDDKFWTDADDFIQPGKIYELSLKVVE